jgi:hypothetical protein
MFDGCVIVKVHLPIGAKHCRDGLELLQRMNISAASLFQGMSGLSRSQYNNLIRLRERERFVSGHATVKAMRFLPV